MSVRAELSGYDWQILGLLPGEWVWRHIGERETDLNALTPPAGDWISATVPGDVPSDLRDAGLLPDPWFGTNSRACEWVAQRDWVYRKTFSLPPEMQDKKRLRIRFGGVDYACQVFLNGAHLGEHSGMNDAFTFDVTDVIDRNGSNTLLVVVQHAPTEPDIQGQIGFTSQIRLWKPRFAYGWDGATRLIPQGIWQEVTLLADNGIAVEELHITPTLQPDDSGNPFGMAQVRLALTIEADRDTRADVVLDMTGPDVEGGFTGQAILRPGTQQVLLSFPLFSPHLWYPNGSGKQPLYHLNLSLQTPDGGTEDTKTARFGVRQVRALQNGNAPEEELPCTLEVNGTRTFIKGWNWVPVDQLYGRSHTEKYQHLIGMAKEANCNLLRVWGGGLLERDTFYSLCDEAGIMVWQDFLQSASGINNEPATDPEYLALCRHEAEIMIRARRNHPSLVLWCGGSALTTADSRPLTETHPTIAAIKETVERLDPDRIFLPTTHTAPENRGILHAAPDDGTYAGNPAHTALNSLDPQPYEFGVEGATNSEAFSRFLAPDAVWPLDQPHPDRAHHGAWWRNRERVEELFGTIETHEEFVRASQWLQAEGLRYAVESGRRREGQCAGTLPRQCNESWPNASSTSAIDYYGQPKPAYWWMRRAYAPFLLSLRYARVQWQPGEEFTAEVWFNASPGAGDTIGGTIRAVWRLLDVATGRTLAEDTVTAPLAAAIEPLRMTTLRYRLPNDYHGVFALQVGGAVEGRLDTDATLLESGRYLFSTHTTAPFASLLSLPQTRLRISQVGGGETNRNVRALSVRNVGDVTAVYLSLSLPEAPYGVVLDGNYRVIAPGEMRWFTLRGREKTLPERLEVNLSAWNVAPRRLKI